MNQNPTVVYSKRNSLISKHSVRMLPFLFLSFILLSVTASDITAQNAVTVDWKKLRELDLATGKMTPSLAGLNGKSVRVPGFMIPLEDGMGTTSEFLLAPFALACIHVPAPPANQIIHVLMKGNKQATVYWYEPVWVYGTLKIEKSETILTLTSYVMKADKITLLSPADLGGNYFD
jgi:uncharacterized protein